MIVLTAGDWRAEIDPSLGGSILSLTFRDRPILRPTPAGANDPLQTACFPLVPYANRIDHGRFRFDDKAFDVSATSGFEPHALHGLGWLKPWTVSRADAAVAVLTFSHAGPGWPWAFEAEQRFALSERGLRIDLTLTNRDARPAPAGVGLHPYFHRSADARLTVAAPQVWLSDDSLIPRQLAKAEALFDWSGSPLVADAPFVDNAYEGWTGEARLASSEGAVTLSAPSVSRVHVYAPQGADFVCIEPVSHRPDALNAPADEASGLAILQPGETLSLSMTIGAT